jgi:hypothetical protein
LQPVVAEFRPDHSADFVVGLALAAQEPRLADSVSVLGSDHGSIVEGWYDEFRVLSTGSDDAQRSPGVTCGYDGA